MFIFRCVQDQSYLILLIESVMIILPLSGNPTGRPKALGSLRLQDMKDLQEGGISLSLELKTARTYGFQAIICRGPSLESVLLLVYFVLSFFNNGTYVYQNIEAIRQQCSASIWE